MITMTPTSIATKSGRCVARVPAVSGTLPCRASDPASSSTSTIGTSRPDSIARPVVTWKNVDVTARPPNALPLLLAAEV